MGRALLNALADRARSARCRVIDLDSATHRTGAHRFYAREQLAIRAFHFAADLPEAG